jgi:hypothetical protein
MPKFYDMAVPAYTIVAFVTADVWPFECEQTLDKKRERRARRAGIA